MHIVKSPCIRGKAVHGNGCLAVLSRFCGQILLREIIPLNLIRVMSIIICLLRTDGIFCIKRCHSTRSAGIFPFRFRRQAVAVCSPVPYDSLPFYCIGRLKAFFFASGIAVTYGIQPCYILHRKITARKGGRILFHDFLVLRLRQFINTHVKVTDSYCMLRFIFRAPVF